MINWLQTKMKAIKDGRLSFWEYLQKYYPDLVDEDIERYEHLRQEWRKNPRNIGAAIICVIMCSICLSMSAYLLIIRYF